MTKASTAGQMTVASDFIGLDLSDQTGTYVVLSAQGQVVREGKLKLTRDGLSQAMGQGARAHVAIEVGTHSPWVSRCLSEMGHEVTVANARQLRLISQGPKKNDRVDAENLARLLRLDPALLHPINHRGETAQADLAALRSRDLLVRSRTSLINSTRGMVKTRGGRLPRCSAASFDRKVREHIPAELAPALAPILECIAKLSEQIAAATRSLEKLAEQRYPETALLRQARGIGVITSLGYVLTLEDPRRFAKGRAVGAFLGMTPRQYESGDSQPQLRITKAGDAFLRRLLVQSAQYMLGRYGEDCDLRRWGLKLAGDGKNKARKKKAVVAVARKLAVLLHRLWLTGEVYEPLRQASRVETAS